MFFFAQEISIVNEEIKDLNKALNYFMSTNTMNSFDVQKRCNQYIYHKISRDFFGMSTM